MPSGPKLVFRNEEALLFRAPSSTSPSGGDDNRRSFAFSPAVAADLGLDQPVTLGMIRKDKMVERLKLPPPHVMLARIARLFRRPTAAQRAIEADADALAASYGLWHGQRIAAVCGALDEHEAGRTPGTWGRIAHELSWQMGCEEERLPTTFHAEAF